MKTNTQEFKSNRINVRLKLSEAKNIVADLKGGSSDDSQKFAKFVNARLSQIKAARQPSA
jgi:hypothetical protein